MSEGYPAYRGRERSVTYDMAFGGLPSNTYTTVTLHSSPSLLLKMIVNMHQYDGDGLISRFLGFSTELHTPISIFTEEGYAISADGWDVASDADTLYPAILFSFEGSL